MVHMAAVYWLMAEVRGYGCNQRGVPLDLRPWTVKQERDAELSKLSWMTALVGMPSSHREATFGMEQLK